MAAVGLLLVVCPPKERTWKIWIPCLVNIAVNLTAFFSPVAFSYDQDYEFVRGPLGYVVFVVSFLYLVQILYVIRKRFYEGKTAERWLLIICSIGCVGASVVDVFYGGIHINEAIVISGVFLFIYLRFHDNNLDPLTSLRNRFAFYNDIEQLSREISAAATLDMNGLKELNDTKGHAEGDQALAAIGRCLNEICSRNTVAYRVGGDEFTLIFIRQNETAVKETLQQIKDSIADFGYSISVGYAMKAEGQSIDDLLRESDENMYKDKATYYLNGGKDRRTSARN